jgi:hypothetical protein
MANRARYLAQSVMLSGLDLNFFTQGIQSIQAVDDKFSKYFESDQRVQWKKESYLGHDAITFSNRYFTNVSKHSYKQGVPFTFAEDPSGKLYELGNRNELLHCEENVVKYYFHKEGRYAPIQSFES